MGKITLITLIVLIFLISVVSAEIQILPPVKTETCVNLPQSYANSTFQNITLIQLPDKTFISVNKNMQSNAGGFYNYTFCNTSQNGEYIVNGIGDIDGTYQTWNYKFEVNPFGKVFTSSQAILYFLIFIVSLIFLFAFLAFGIYLPVSNTKDQITGYIFAVNNLKYVKVICLAFAYLCTILMAYFGWMISYGYLDLQFIGDIFHFAFIGLLALLIPLFILGVIFSIFKAVEDSKVSEALNMGLRIRE